MKRVAPGGATFIDLWTAFADGLISIDQLLFAIHKAWCQCVAYLEGTNDAFHFLLAEFTSAFAAEYSVVLIHTSAPLRYKNPET
jgi:hypothetical protein